MGTIQSSYFSVTPIQVTPEQFRGNDYCNFDINLLSESEFKVLVPSFGFQLLGSIQWSSYLSRCSRGSDYH
ncbi:hypothetical protein Tco_0071185 [Tanacetum coccineum]